MVDGRARSGVALASFVAGEPLVAGQQLTLGEDAARHMRVRRIVAGESVRVLDGAGHSAEARVVRLARTHVVVALAQVLEVSPSPAVHMIVPVADRDRMLLLAEKCTELGATSWRPVLWKRSKSVSPRGEGSAFQGKLRARMAAALAQSSGGWLPVLYPDASVERAAAAAPAGVRLLLDPAGAPLLEQTLREPVTLAVGPEGGLEDDEREVLLAAGFALASLAGNILRFETAGMAALAIARAVLARALEVHPTDG